VFWYKFGVVIGVSVNVLMCLYVAYDAYVNITNGNSILLDLLALLFISFSRTFAKFSVEMQYMLWHLIESSTLRKKNSDLDGFQKLLNDFGKNKWDLKD
jgi:hypothetical protein